ncbi:hypothetical protein JXL83_08230 [candidate division WOR-3 bacterium]|nr:hypothetical protein [candidate division WOR-3 bacterium]
MRDYSDFFNEEFGDYLDSDGFVKARSSIGKKLHELCETNLKNLELLTETKIRIYDDFHAQSSSLAEIICQMPENLFKKGVDLVTKIVFCGILSRVMGTEDYFDENISDFFECVIFHIAVIGRKQRDLRKKNLDQN